MARYGLGPAYLETDAFAEAHSEFDRCFNRRGEATATNQIQIPDQWVAGLRTVATAEASTKILMDSIDQLGQREAEINAEFDPEELASLIR